MPANTEEEKKYRAQSDARNIIEVAKIFNDEERLKMARKELKKQAKAADDAESMLEKKVEKKLNNMENSDNPKGEEY